jgi:hypothetical protein
MPSQSIHAHLRLHKGQAPLDLPGFTSPNMAGQVVTSNSPTIQPPFCRFPRAALPPQLLRRRVAPGNLNLGGLKSHHRAQGRPAPHPKVLHPPTRPEVSSVNRDTSISRGSFALSMGLYFFAVFSFTWRSLAAGHRTGIFMSFIVQ